MSQRKRWSPRKKTQQRRKEYWAKAGVQHSQRVQAAVELIVNLDSLEEMLSIRDALSERMKTLRTSARRKTARIVDEHGGKGSCKGGVPHQWEMISLGTGLAQMSFCGVCNAAELQDDPGDKPTAG